MRPHPGAASPPARPSATPSAPPDSHPRPSPPAASRRAATQSDMVSSWRLSFFSAKENLLSAYQDFERRVATFYDLPGISLEPNRFVNCYWSVKRSVLRHKNLRRIHDNYRGAKDVIRLKAYERGRRDRPHVAWQPRV